MRVHEQVNARVIDEELQKDTVGVFALAAHGHLHRVVVVAQCYPLAAGRAQIGGVQRRQAPLQLNGRIEGYLVFFVLEVGRSTPIVTL